MTKDTTTASNVGTEYVHSDLTYAIIGAFRRMFDALGFGFLESVYRRALATQLRHEGLFVEEEVPISVYHLGVEVGFFRADLLVNRTVVLEIKTGEKLDPMARPQLLNYLRASGHEVGLVLHVGHRPDEKRVFNTK